MNETKKRMLIELEAWLERFELTSVNEDAITSGKDWCSAGFKAGYKKGMLEGIARYAIWKDGIQWLGCGNHTLKEGIQIIWNELGE